MKVRLHTSLVTGHGREPVEELHASDPHFHFFDDGRVELRWSTSDNAAHTHNQIVRVEMSEEQGRALRELVARHTRVAHGQRADEPPPPPSEDEAPPVDPSMPEWTPPDEPRPDGKPWTPPGVEPEPLEEETKAS